MGGLVLFGDERTDDGFRRFCGGSPHPHPTEVEESGFGRRVSLGDDSRFGDGIGGGFGGNGVAHRRNLIFFSVPVKGFLSFL